MALTAAPPHPLHTGHGPSWDETIVPALRARLEDESRVLAHRISAASLASSAGGGENHWDIYDAYAAPDNDYPKPTAIPRPSLSSQPQPITTTPQQPKTRKRTLSSPKLPVMAVPKSPSLGVGGNGSSGGAGKTRIPVARARTGSTGSRATSANGVHAAGGSSTPDLGALASRANAQARTPDLSYPHSPQSNNSSYFGNSPSPREEAGRPSMSSHLRRRTGEDDDVRASMESDERPFEHWYRGEASRNGGVGEYRVGRRQEMLEIANYGHNNSRAANPRAGGVNGTGYTGEWVNTSLKARRGSTGARLRESFYLDPDQAGGNVLDEVLDLDTADSASEDVHGRMSSHGHGRKGHKPPAREEEEYEEYEEDEGMDEDEDETWHATPKVADPRTPTPTQMTQRSITTDAALRSRATPSPAALNNRSASTPSPQPPRTTPNGTPASATAKRRAKSPAAATPPNAKKANKARSPPSAAASARAAVAGKGGEKELRRSSAAYPELGDDDEADMSHAIPTWTQPAKVGNWDEVVLPAVARKKGLEGYVRADGSPQPKEEREQVIEPAPGTFGYDYSKYKPGQRGESIPMDEFGAHVDPDALAEEAAREDEQYPEDPASPKSPIRREKALPPLQTSPSMRRAMQQPPSPAPFSRYVAQEGMTMDTSQIPQTPGQQQEMRVEEGSGGCCKCVVM